MVLRLRRGLQGDKPVLLRIVQNWHAEGLMAREMPSLAKWLDLSAHLMGLASVTKVCAKRTVVAALFADLMVGICLPQHLVATVWQLPVQKTLATPILKHNVYFPMA